MQTPEWRRKQKEGAQKSAKKPERILAMKAGGQKRAQDPKWKYNNKEAAQKRVKNPEYLDKIKEVNRKTALDPEWRRNNKEAAQKRSQDPEWIRAVTYAARKRSIDPEYLIRLQEGVVGGFCIQNITYRDPSVYCELWCPDLWKRIDEAQNYQSILSGKTKEDNIDKHGETHTLSRHHVYWQPKACCVWDEDAQGYYALIEIGTKKHPNRIKYYIKGDPNKFVLLTMSEHAMIKNDKIKWIEIFENLIETKLGGVCYLPMVVA
jgi:hypothetical protein